VVEEWHPETAQEVVRIWSWITSNVAWVLASDVPFFLQEANQAKTKKMREKKVNRYVVEIIFISYCQYT
jgi:hypothetical protein